MTENKAEPITSHIKHLAVSRLVSISTRIKNTCNLTKNPFGTGNGEYYKRPSSLAMRRLEKPEACSCNTCFIVLILVIFPAMIYSPYTCSIKENIRF